MDNDKYNKRAEILNKIAQYTDKINELSVELQDYKDIEFKNISKLNKSLTLLDYFVKNERKFMKKVRSNYYKKQNNE